MNEVEEPKEKTLPDVGMIKKLLPKINTKAEWMDLADMLLGLENVTGLTNTMKVEFLRKYREQLVKQK